MSAARGIILAAGRGSRMQAMTGAQPKCLIELGGRSLLDWQYEALTHAGVEPVAVVTGYRREMLQGDARFSFFTNEGWEETNMVATLTFAAPWLVETDCVVSYSDIVYHPSAIEALLAAEGDICVTFDRQWRELWELRFDDPLDDAETFRLNSDGTLREIGQSPGSVDEVEGQYMGLLKFTPAGWSSVERLLSSLEGESLRRLDMTALLNRLLRADVQVRGVGVSGKWCEVDSQEDWVKYDARLEQADRWPHDWRWQENRGS